MLNTKLVILAVALLVSGCVGPKEAIKGILGVSTHEVEAARKEAIAKSFFIGYDTCYSKTLDILKKIKSPVYAQDPKKGMIALYVSDNDTTSVGIFFNTLSSRITEIEVSSRSTYFKNKIAQEIFAAMEKEIKSSK
jgi:hypothetical protein